MREEFVVIGALVMVGGVMMFPVVRAPTAILIPFIGLAGLVLIIVGFALPDRIKVPQHAAYYPMPRQLFCPDCGNPMTWIPEYVRDYCYWCKKYV
ncbi:MAG: hypothetical protein KAW09_10490 [Thermoplasmata archaeon]|nr:hypothetical protein [Thermoplasmata archaeon]